MERDLGYTELLDRIIRVTQPERKALRDVIMDGLGLRSTMDQPGSHLMLAIQSGQNAQDQVEATKVALMLAAANQHLDPFRTSDHRLDSPKVKTYLDSLEENVVTRFLRAVVNLEEQTLTVAEPFFARIQSVLVAEELLVELDRSRKLPSS